MEQNKIISDEIKGWDKQMPAPLNWKSLISGKVQAVVLAMHSVAGQVTASLDTSSWGTHTGSSRHAWENQKVLKQIFQFRWRSAQTSSLHSFSTLSRTAPFSLICLRVGGAAAPSGYLACGATPGHKGGKHRSTTTLSLKRALLPLRSHCHDWSRAEHKGGEFLFPEQKQAFEQQFLPKHNRKKQRRRSSIDFQGINISPSNETIYW